MENRELLPKLWLCLDRRLGDPERAWLERAESAQGREMRSLFAAVSRRVGRGPLLLSATERSGLEHAGLRRPLLEWRLDDLARALLLLSAAKRLEESVFEAMIIDLYKGGASRERQAVLRSLPLLPEAPLFLPLALQASRDPEASVFEAIACGNSYPADRFPEHAFNELVLRALSMGFKLDRIVGLETRRSAALSRLAVGFADSRRAAGRGVPADFDRLEAASI